MSNCMICDKPEPSGHIVVVAKSVIDEIRGNPGHAVGVICSSHTVWEIISDPKDRFTLDLWMEDGTIGGST